MIKMADCLKASQEIMEKNTDFLKKLLKCNEMIISPPEVKVGQTPGEIVYRKHKTKLIRYKPVKKNLFETPILISYALVNKPYIVDLLPGRSIVEILVNNGFDVFLIDWGEPTVIDSKLGLDEYVNFYMHRMVEQTKKLTGSEKITLLGYCMGGTMSLMYTALHQENIQNLITMTTPFDCSKNDGLLFQWSKEFPASEVGEIYGVCPGWLLGSSFVLLNPMKQMDKALNFYKGMLNPSFVDLFLAMEKWLQDTIDLSAKVYTEVIEDWFQKNLLMKNEIVLGDQKVDFKKITCSYLNLVAEQDSTIPPEASTIIGDHISSKDKKLLTAPVGHIGLSSVILYRDG